MAQKHLIKKSDGFMYLLMGTLVLLLSVYFVTNSTFGGKARAKRLNPTIQVPPPRYNNELESGSRPVRTYPPNTINNRY